MSISLIFLFSIVFVLALLGLGVFLMIQKKYLAGGITLGVGILLLLMLAGFFFYMWFQFRAAS